MNLMLKARVNRSDAQTIQQALDQLAAKGPVRKEGKPILRVFRCPQDSGRAPLLPLIPANDKH